MCRFVTILSLVMLGICVSTFSMPLVDNPYLSMTINRDDQGSGFTLGVNRQNTNLVVSGRLAQFIIKCYSSDYFQDPLPLP